MQFKEKRRDEKLDAIPVITKKPRTLGERRLKLEAGYADLNNAESLEDYINQYNNLVDSIADTLRERGIGPRDEEEFIVETWAILYGALDIKLESQAFLIDCFRNGRWDCDTTSTVVYDVGKKLGIVGLALVETGDHIFVKTENFYFDTASYRTYPNYGTIDDMNAKYPDIYGVYSTSSEIRAIEWAVIGLTMARDNKHKDAIVALERSLRIKDVGSPNAYITLGNSYAELDDFDSSAKYFEAVIKTRPNNTDAIYGLAEAKYVLGEFEEAKKLCKRGLKLKPGDKNFKQILKDIREEESKA